MINFTYGFIATILIVIAFKFLLKGFVYVLEKYPKLGIIMLILIVGCAGGFEYYTLSKLS